MDTIGERIIHLRESKKMSQRQLMDALKFNNLSRFEKNESKPGIEIIISLSDYFDVSTDWILKGEERAPDVDLHQEQLPSPSDMEFLAKFHQLTDVEQAKVEGIVEGILLSSNRENKREPSPNSTNTERREDAAGSKTA